MSDVLYVPFITSLETYVCADDSLTGLLHEEVQIVEVAGSFTHSRFQRCEFLAVFSTLQKSSFFFQQRATSESPIDGGK